MLTNPFLEGIKINLSGLSTSDAHGSYSKWINDTEVLRYLEARFSAPYSPEDLEEYIDIQNRRANTLFLGMFENQTMQHIGNIKLDINPGHHIGEVSLVIGKEYWRKGYGSEAIDLLTHYAFNNIHLHKLTAGMYANNTASIALFEKCDFVIEGRMKEQWYCDGEYVDGIRMGLLRGW